MKEVIQIILGKALSDSNKIAAAILDTEMNFIFGNPSMCSRLGYKLNELKKITVFDILRFEDHIRANHAIDRFLKLGIQPEVTWRVVTGYGHSTQITIQASKECVNGKEYIVVIALDNTLKLKTDNSEQNEPVIPELAEEFNHRGSFDVNILTKELRWSKGMYLMLDMEPGEVAPSFNFQKRYLRPIDADFLENAIYDCYETGNEHEQLINVTLNNGTKKYLNIIIARNEFDHDWIHGIVIDQTLTVFNQKRIRQSEQKYRLLTETIPHMIWTSDPDGKPTYINHYGLNFFGVSNDDLMNWNWFDYYHPDESEYLKSRSKEIVADKTTLFHTHRFKRFDDEFIWFQVTIFPDFNSNNEVTSWTGIATDIHQLKIAEEDIQYANERIRALINASPVPIYSIDLAGNVKDLWNPAAERLLGWSRDEVIGKPLPHVASSDRAEFRRIAKLTKEKGQINRILKRRNKKGKLLTLDVTGGALFDENGEVTEIFVTLIDITRSELNKRKLEKSLREKETLLQEVHHRVKNNLSIIVSLIQLQSMNTKDLTDTYNLSEIENRIRSIAMVHELLYKTNDFSNVNLSKYYRKLIKSIIGSSLEGDITVERVLDIQLSAININQAIPLGLLLNEVITNSAKYAFSKDRSDNQLFLAIKEADGYINVIYKDSGPGFDPEKINDKSGIGHQIINALIEQLEATKEINTQDGFSMELRFKPRKKGPSATI